MYQVIILPKVVKDLLRLDKVITKRITDKLTWLSNNIETMSIIPLKGDLSGFYKLAVGDYRVIYEVETITKKL